jgi:hypothetical protein
MATSKACLVHSVRTVKGDILTSKSAQARGRDFPGRQMGVKV